METDRSELLMREYQDLGSNMRQYNTTRTARLAMLFALNGGLFASGAAMQRPKMQASAGILISLLFWLADVHIRRYWGVFRQRAIEIEKELGLQQYQAMANSMTIPGRGLKRWLSSRIYFSSTFSTRATFALLVLIWTAKLLAFW